MQSPPSVCLTKKHMQTLIAAHCLYCVCVMTKERKIYANYFFYAISAFTSPQTLLLLSVIKVYFCARSLVTVSHRLCVPEWSASFLFPSRQILLHRHLCRFATASGQAIWDRNEKSDCPLTPQPLPPQLFSKHIGIASAKAFAKVRHIMASTHTSESETKI